LIRVLFDPTQRDFFNPTGNKLKNLGFLGEIFQTQTKDGWPNPTRPEQQKIDPVLLLIKEKLEQIMMAFYLAIGMVTNIEKTELFFL